MSHTTSKILFINIHTDLTRRVKNPETLSNSRRGGIQASSFHLKARILSLATILLVVCLKVSRPTLLTSEKMSARGSRPNKHRLTVAFLRKRKQQFPVSYHQIWYTAIQLSVYFPFHHTKSYKHIYLGSRFNTTNNFHQGHI